MKKKVLILQGSPNKDGNTATLVQWFAEVLAGKAEIEIIHTASLRYKALGCTSCRACQASQQYACVINDEAQPILAKMAHADVIVMATPLYFFSASAQLKLIFDRMFSLYKWDNLADTFETPLRGKTLLLIASAFEEAGLHELEAPFRLTADYTGMQFSALLVAHAGESGDIKKNLAVREKAFAFGRKVVA